MAAARNPRECRVLLLHDRPQLYLDALRARFPAVRFSTCTEPQAIPDALAAARPQVVFSCKCAGLPGPLHRAALEWLDVEWIQVAGTGFDHLQPVDRGDVVITNAAGVLAPFMAETVLGAMLMLNTRFHTYLAQQRERVWRMQPWTALAGKTVLVIGLGTIGRRVAAHARHLGMHVLGLRAGTTPVREVHEMVPPERLHGALARADAVCVHVPLVPSTHKLLDAQAFAQLKPGAIIVNTARGGVMDEQALLAALADGRVAAAHLDVFETEPLPPDSPLWDTPNLVITPHMADAVSDWETRFAQFFADNLQRWMDGEALLNQVDPARGY
jgi:phosphoglycerate dehydrogenase-like enzyme